MTIQQLQKMKLILVHAKELEAQLEVDTEWMKVLKTLVFILYLWLAYFASK